MLQLCKYMALLVQSLQMRSFRHAQKKVHSSVPPPAKYDNTLIPETDTYKHLGIMQLSDGKLPNDVDALKC